MCFWFCDAALLFGDAGRKVQTDDGSSWKKLKKKMKNKVFLPAVNKVHYCAVSNFTLCL